MIRSPDDRRSLLATLVGGIAVLLWSLLALLTVWAGNIPPFQLLAMTFSIAAVVMFIVVVRRGLGALETLQQPASAWALGVGGFFGYHFAYFIALRNAPPAEASLICFLWPLLVVLLSGLAPGQRLRWFQLLGAFLGFVGAALLVTGGEFAFQWEYWPGYLAALCAAVIWSTYSVANRRFQRVPSEIVAGYCAVVAVLGYFCHLTFEKTMLPDSLWQWLAVLALGIGPVGLAFYAWDFGTKRGNLPVLGALSYGAPLISTVLLIVTGHAAPTWAVAVACVLIVAGAVIAAHQLLLPRRQAEVPPPSATAVEPPKQSRAA
ncbi:MAG TPA: DMT family transporter [Kiloniellales bacterium]|nr:DMT family transporter [Kiloniellales bacterium]